MSTTPTVEQVEEAMKQSGARFPNLKIRTTHVRLRDEGFLGPPAEEQALHVTRSLTLRMGDKYFVDQNTTTIHKEATSVNRERQWDDKSRNICSVVHDNAYHGGPAALETKLRARTHDVTMTQLDSKRVFLVKGARIVGTQDHHGLKCLRVEWGEKGQTECQGHTLVCPSRGHRVLYEEYSVDIKEGNHAFTSDIRRMSVERIEQFGDAWVPTRVFDESRRMGTDGKPRVQTEKFWVVEFAPDAVTVDLLFEPLLSPGTAIFPKAAPGRIEFAGGDITPLVAQLQSGDLSPLAEEVEDMSQP